MDTIEVNFQRKVADFFCMIECQPYAHQVGIISDICDFVNGWMAKHELGRIVVDGSWNSDSSHFQPDTDACENSPSPSTYDSMTETCHEKDCSAVSEKEASFTAADVSESSIKQDYSETENDGNSSSTSLEYEEIDRYLSTIDSTKMVHDLVSNEPGCSRKLKKLKPDDVGVNDGSNLNDSTENNFFQSVTASDGQTDSDMKSPVVKVKRRMRRKSCSQVGAELNGSPTKGMKERRRVKQITVDGSFEGVSLASVERVECEGKLKFQCPECKDLFSRGAHLQRHMRLHFGERFRCPICSQEFSRPEHVRRHVIIHHGVTSLPACGQLHKCLLCDEKFKRVDALGKHMRTQHCDESGASVEAGGVNASLSSKASLSLMALLMPRSKIKPTHECSFCNESFKTVQKLHSHLATAHGYKHFMCSECGQRFTRPDHLQRHMALHSGAKPFMCNLCAQQFSRADHLRRHIRHHAEQTAKDAAAAAMAGVKVEDDAVPPATCSSSDAVSLDDVSLPSVPSQDLVLDLSTAADSNHKFRPEASTVSSQPNCADE